MQICKLYNQHFHFRRLTGRVPVDWVLHMNAQALDLDLIIQNRSHHVQADISIMYMCNFMQTKYN